MTNPSNVLEQYIGHINRLRCAADIKNWTDTNRCYDIAENTVRWCRALRERELLGLTVCKYGGQRVERGVFSVLCGVSKIHFVTIDCDVAHCYSEQTECFEQNSESVTGSVKQQLCVVKLS